MTCLSTRTARPHTASTRPRGAPTTFVSSPAGSAPSPRPRTAALTRLAGGSMLAALATVCVAGATYAQPMGVPDPTDIMADPSGLELVSTPVVLDDRMWQTGQIAAPGDDHWFHLVVAKGTRIIVETAVGSLDDTVLELFDTDRTTRLAYDDDGGTGRASQIVWTAPADRRVYLRVTGYGAATGRFAIHAVTALRLTMPWGLPTVGDGEIVRSGDDSWRAFFATVGYRYVITTTAGTLTDTTVALVGPDGVTQLAFDDDGGAGRTSQIAWTAPSTGVYFVRVRGYGSDTGTFGLYVHETAPQSATPPAQPDCADCWVCDDEWCYPCECA